VDFLEMGPGVVGGAEELDFCFAERRLYFFMNIFLWFLAMVEEDKGSHSTLEQGGAIRPDMTPNT
jgi:hypothetical protein